MSIFRRNTTPRPSTPPQDNIFRGGDEPIGATPAPPPIPDTVAPVNSVAPSIAGTLTAGATLTVTPGVWSGSPNITRAWFRDGVLIPNRTGLTYLTTTSDIGTTVTHIEYASNAAGTVSQVSNGLAIVTPVPDAPAIVNLPFITANSSPITTGTVLSGQSGDYTSVDSSTRQWYRDGVAISGATLFNYTVASIDIGNEITYADLLTNTGGTTKAESAAIVPTIASEATGLLQTIELSQQPVDVSVSRSSTGATYRNAAGAMVVAAANTPRYHHALGGVFEGIYVERSRTNYYPNAEEVGSGATLGSGVTVTLNNATDPKGTTKATRIQITAGTAQRGVTRGFAVPAGSLRSSVWLRDRTGGTSSIILRDPATGYQTVNVTGQWQRFDFVSQNGGSWFNHNILSADGLAKDIEAWLGDVTPDGVSSDSLIVSGNGIQQRLAEVLTIATFLSGTRDIRVTFNDNSAQTILNQSLAEGFVNLSALQLNKTLVKKVEVFSVGTIPGASAPTPPPTSAVYPNPELVASSQYPVISLTKPGYLESLAFGGSLQTSVKRIMNSEKYHGYSTWQSWNADRSMLLLRDGVNPSGHVVLDGNTFSIIKSNWTPPGYGLCVFDPNLPNIAWGHDGDGGGNHLYKYNFDTETTTTYTLGSYLGINIGKGEGSISRDGRYIVLACQTSGGFDICVFDTTTGTIVSTLAWGAAGLDNCHISPSGAFVVVAPNSGGHQIYDRQTMSLLRTHSTFTGHMDIGYRFGTTEECMFRGSSSGELVSVRLTDGNVRVELPVSMWNYHISARNYLRPGYFYVSGSAQSDVTGEIMYREIFAVKADGTGTIERFAQNMASETSQYRRQAHVLPTPDGSVVLFKSDWKEAGVTTVYPYIAGMFSPTPPPPVSGVWTSEEVETAIQTATGLNDGLIINVNNSAGGWRSGSGLGMGNRWNCLDPMPQGWSWPKGNYPTQNWPYFYPWGVIFIEQGNVATTDWIEFRNCDWQVLYRNASEWTRITPKNNNIGWGELFLSDMITSSGVSITKATGSGGGTRILVPDNRSPHFTFSPAGILVPNVGDIEGIMVSAEMRIDPGYGTQTLKALVHVGGDPKPTTQGGAADGVLWYPGVQCSRATRVTTSWKRVTACNLVGIRTDSTQVPRLMTLARFRAVPPKV